MKLQLKEKLAKLKRIIVKVGKEKEVYVPPPPETAIPRKFKIIERHPLYEPFAHVAIG
ncbi:MAG: hypothetical protein GWN17_08910, partial [Candidatus Korarchaeota archaeon]|nr:hypothetical protein [Candidatus Thorarchaeota archaeon]NIW52322.1 hypothetical protein [Candidatus Korarchaeota archaeon]